MQQSDRIAFYDNLRFVLILLVVVGHVLGCTLDNGYVTGIYIFIYAFHMPLFIFVTGFFAKKLEDKNEKFRLNKVISYFSLYLIFKVTLFVFMKFILHQNVSFYLFTEHDAPWYLLACVLWLCFTYLIKNVKPKYMLVVSLLFALLVGYDYYVEDVFVLSRTIVFYPFFLLGYYLSKEQLGCFIERIHKRKIQIVALIFILILLFCLIIFARDLDFLRPFILGTYTYDIDIPFNNNLFYPIIRFICLLFAVIISVAVMSLIPRRNLFFTKLGSRTLQIYILHLFFIYLVFYTKIESYLVDFFGNIWPFMLFVLPVLLTFFLSFKFLGKPFNKIMNLKYKYIFNDLK